MTAGHFGPNNFYRSLIDLSRDAITHYPRLHLNPRCGMFKRGRRPELSHHATIIPARCEGESDTLDSEAESSCMPACIEGRNVNLTFRPPNRRPVRALHGFDIDVQECEFLSIVGPSGCGKTTFLNVVLGLIKPDSGELRIRGKPISGPGTDRAMVFQEFGLLPWRTVLNNIELGLELKGVPPETRRHTSRRSSIWSALPDSRDTIRMNCRVA
jgi:ABC-type glutathione transport system ATPase component